MRRAFLAAAVLLSTPLLRAAGPPMDVSKPAAISRADVQVVNGSVRLAGSLLLPANRTGPLPAVVFLQGSGDQTRDWFEQIASRVTEGGFAALIFDKRGSGRSSGSWKTSSLEDLAGDGAAAVRFLAARPEVDRERVGVCAVSQAGWYGPLVAARAPVAFLVVVTGGGSSPRETEWQGYEHALDARGVVGEDRMKARALVHRYLDYLATGSGYEELRADIQRYGSEPWYAAVRVGDVLPSEEDRKNWSWVGTFQPASSTESLRIPVLLFFGGRDPFVPSFAPEAWARALARSRATVTMRTFPEAGHGMVLGEHGHSPSAPRRYAAGYLETLVAWLDSVEGRTPAARPSP